jgi:sulfate permease, SulP family
MKKLDSIKNKINSGDILGGIAAMLLALPSAIAYGLVAFSPLGYLASNGAVAGIVGNIFTGIIAPLFGRTPILITSPSAPAAAVISIFAADMIEKNIPLEIIPLLIILVSFGAGIVQLLAGILRGGDFIKFIPYPVVAGFLSGVGLLLLFSQTSKFLGISGFNSIEKFLQLIPDIRHESILIGTITIIVMVMAPKLSTKIPGPIASLLAGTLTYFAFALNNPNFLNLENNPMIIGKIDVSPSSVANKFLYNLQFIKNLDSKYIEIILYPSLTLGVLLSIDTLKTCVILDVLTGNRHKSNQELFGQGLANIGSSFAGGMPGAGIMGATMVNYYGGGKTNISGLIASLLSLVVILFFSSLLSWLPIASLAGVLIVIGFRMIDFKSIKLLLHRNTMFDFAVILAVTYTAVTTSLISAAGVGIALALLIFIREQFRFSVIRRKSLGHLISSKKTRTPSERKIISKDGEKVITMELQGQLFFGTTDQLYTEIEPYFSTCEYFILDMKRVQSIDFTAVNMLTQIKKKIIEKNGTLIFTSIPQTVPSGKNVQVYLKNLGLDTDMENLLFFPQFTDGLEWTEDRLIQNHIKSNTKKILLLEDFEFFKNTPKNILKKLYSIIYEEEYENGSYIFKKDQNGGDIFFIRSGMIRISIPLTDTTYSHRATFGKGGFFGDMSFLDQEPRSADAIAVGDVKLYKLNKKDFDRLTKDHPKIGVLFYQKLSYQLSNRIRVNVMELTNLEL